MEQDSGIRSIGFNRDESLTHLPRLRMGFGDATRWIHKWVLNEENSRPIIKKALELGINFFDTANVYSIGASEEILGRALKDFAKREEVVIATKVYFPMGSGPNERGLSRKHILSSIDASLKRLDVALITPRPETSAAHMAGAYARLTGRLGVCMASNGPGVANILPGLVVEEAEGNRVLCLTSARRTGAMYPLGTGTYQGFDQTGVIRQIAKWCQEVPRVERLPELMRAALRQCWEGRPGVVHLDATRGPADLEEEAWRIVRARLGGTE